MQTEQGMSSFPQVTAGASYSLPATPQFPYMVYEFPPGALMRGARFEGRMSAVRRFFCLFVTFDLLLTSLLWLITIMLEGEFDVKIVIERQILHYKIRSSLFDTVLASLCRFVILVLFYGFLQINHWIFVALTTAGTGAFVVAKVLMFDWSSSNSQVLKIMLVLSSFILSWAEAWLLDMKVVPQEKFARACLSAPPSVCNERTPLIQNFLQSQAQPDVMSDSHASFYSPEDTSDESLDESKRSVGRRSRRSRRMFEDKSLQNDNYIAKGKEILSSSWETLNCDKWAIEKETEGGDTICSFKLADGRKIYKLTSVLNVNDEDLFKILYKQLEDIPKWNPTVKSAKVLEVINESTDISYQITKEIGRLIASREYVTLRHFEEVGGYKVIASASVLWPRLPTSVSVIRGEVGPSCWAIRPVDPTTSEIKWLLNTKVNGWIPVKAVESALASVMADTMSHLRTAGISTSQPSVL